MPKDLGTRKFAAPLYCAAWPKGDYCLVAGGGGKRSSGIPNRIWCVDHHGSQLGEVAAQLDTNEDAPLRMVLLSSGDTLLLAVGSGGLIRIHLDVKPRLQPQLTKVEGEGTEVLKGLGDVKCISFSRNGRLLAVGCEDGSLQVLEWPSLQTRKLIRGPEAMKDALRDLDFSSAHGNKVLATTCEDGTCVLWEWASGTQIAAVDLPSDLVRGSFNRVRFAHNGGPGFYTTVNCAGVGHILYWEQDSVGEIVLRGRLKAHTTAITAFDVSLSGRFIGTGTSEGEVAIFSTKVLAPLKRVREGHMVFVTAVAFSGDDRGLLSVSADASARTTLVAPERPSSLYMLLLGLLILLVSIALGLFSRYYRS